MFTLDEKFNEGEKERHTAMLPKEITEKDGLQEEWYKQARKQTLETLSEFLRMLAKDYKHDYGTICHACAAAAVGATYAINHSPQGGITGFQAGAIFWEFYRNWMQEDGPAKLLRYENLLYPQYEYSFHEISQDTWTWVQEEACKKLADDSEEDAHPEVLAHWQTIAEGKIPFGLTLATEKG